MDRLELKKQIAILFLLLAALGAGCGKDDTAGRIAGLRAAGEVDSAYTEAVRALTDNARRDAVWREFVRVCLDRTRRENPEDAEPNPVFLVQAGIVCAAMRENTGKQSGEWREVTQLAGLEMERQLSAILGEFGRQQRTARQAAQLRRFPPSDRRNAVLLRETEEQLADFRRDAAPLLRRRAVLEALYEKLPETGGGTKSSLGEQLRLTLEQWLEMLGLEAGSDTAVTESATAAVASALRRAHEDFRELGYLLPNTVIENGVYE